MFISQNSITYLCVTSRSDIQRDKHGQSVTSAPSSGLIYIMQHVLTSPGGHHQPLYKYKRTDDGF